VEDNTVIRFSRRQLLLGAGAVSILTLAWTGYRQVGFYSPPDFPLHNISPKEAKILQVLGDWLIPIGGGITGSGGDKKTIQRIDQILAGVPQQKRYLLHALPLAFEHGSALFSFGSKSMTKMSDDDRENYLNDWANSDNLIRCQLMAALKTLYGFGYFDRPEVLEACGLPYFCGKVS